MRIEGSIETGLDVYGENICAKGLTLNQLHELVSQLVRLFIPFNFAEVSDEQFAEAADAAQISVEDIAQPGP
ncbi:hypothetical protein SAMN05216456_1304 [Devosia crocina]|uniref:Uncharacterized protein n=1 Tax=Devosia crocina TaxID=429728 RepID=A0A1I7N9F1_9HYPH|nr:hypothetical protein [Devosia crocina]SFV31324.1 hypothetical protein SAMN05216456_1304 [Devosia crocina]